MVVATELLGTLKYVSTLSMFKGPYMQVSGFVCIMYLLILIDSLLLMLAVTIILI